MSKEITNEIEEIKKKMMDSIDWEDEWKVMTVKEQKRVVSDHLDWILEMVTPNSTIQQKQEEAVIDAFVSVSRFAMDKDVLYGEGSEYFVTMEEMESLLKQYLKQIKEQKE